MIRSNKVSSSKLEHFELKKPKSMKISFNFRKLLTLLVLSSLPMLLMNCSKDTPSAQIVGTWKIVNIYVKQGTKIETDQLPSLVNALSCAKEIVFIFQKNGKVSYNTPQECQLIANNFSGSSDVSGYEIEDDNLIITGKSTNTYGVSFNKRQMAWTIVDGKGTALMTTTRIILQKQ